MEKAPARTAAALAAALAQCPKAACRRYLPHGRRQGRYWVAGDLHGARGRSLYARIRPPGAATAEHGDLLDLIRHRIGAGTLRPALDEARAFLALPQDFGRPSAGRSRSGVPSAAGSVRDGWNGGGRTMCPGSDRCETQPARPVVVQPCRGRKPAYGHGSHRSRGERRVTQRAEVQRRSREAA